MPPKGTLSGGYSGYINVSNGNYTNPVTLTGTISLATPTIALGASSAWSVVNAGSIIGPGAAGAIGVRLLGGGSVENRAGGTIESYVGVSIYGTGTVTNAAGGFIAGGGGGVRFDNHTTAPELVVNAGTISGGVGVYLAAGLGTLTNAGAGLITGGQAAIAGDGGTIVNDGAIRGNYGIRLFGSGLITNAAGATIDVTGNAIYGRYYLSINNAGTIANGDTLDNPALYRPAILSFRDAVVRNEAGAGIDSQYQGIAGHDPTLLNAGTVNTRGLSFKGDSVSNAAGGVITTDSTLAVYASRTVVNAGTIAAAGSNAIAVQFANAGNYNLSIVRLIVDPGAVFIGTVNGGNTTNSTMELASGRGAIAGFGSSFVNFATVQFDPGAIWTVSGAASALSVPVFAGFAPGSTIELTGLSATYSGFSNGVLTLSNGAHLTFAGAFTGETFMVNAGTNTDITVTRFPGGTHITASSYNGITLRGPAYVNPIVVDAGVGIGPVGANAVSAPSGSWTIQNYGALNAVQLPFSGGPDGISLHSGGAVTNHPSGFIYGERGVFDASGALTLANYGTIRGQQTFFAPLLSTGFGVYAAKGSISNAGGGLIIGFVGVSAATLTNDGTIVGGGRSSQYPSPAGVGVELPHGGKLTNQGSGLIIGYTGIKVETGGGTIDNAGTISSTGVGIFLVSGGSVTNQSGGTISGADGAVTFAAGNTNRLAIAPGAVFVGGADGGNTVGSSFASVLDLMPGPGTLNGVGTSFVNFGSIDLDAGASWLVSGNTAGLAAGQTITGFAPGSTIELTGLDASYSGFSNGVLTLSDGTAVTFDGAFTGEHFVVSPGADTEITVACFAAGARILTATGEVPVERLRAGDRIATRSGRLARITWLGQQRAAAAPVRIRAGAFGDGQPARDLLLSPDHAVFVDGVLVPVLHLVNGMTVVREAAARLTYFHIELTPHGVLLADGLPCESYLDTGNRAGFDGEAIRGDRRLACAEVTRASK